MKVSKMTGRLEKVFSLIPKAKAIADVGTDHGYLAVELLVRGRAQHVIAGDVNQGPLATAERYVRSRNLSAYIECRLGDGLRMTRPGELTGAVICGMGGFLMKDIVEGGPEDLEFYVLQPQNGQGQLRSYMVDKGYVIVRDTFMQDMGKQYQAFLAIRKDCLEDYVRDHKIVIHPSLEGVEVPDSALGANLYDTLNPKSLLWELGGMVVESDRDSWTDYLDHLIHIRRCALDGMGPALEATHKYRTIYAEIDQLESIRKEGL